MALKRKLSEQIARMANGASDLVHIHVPPVDPAVDLIRGSKMFVDTVAALVEERDDLKKENEDLRGRVDFLMKANKHIADEREECRKKSDAFILNNGKLSATLDGMQAFIDMMSGTIRESRKIPEPSYQQVEQPAPQPREVYDTNGMPLDVPPQITLEECESMSTVLARAEA